MIKANIIILALFYFSSSVFFYELVYPFYSLINFFRSEILEKRGIYEDCITNNNKICLEDFLDYMSTWIMANDNLGSI